jgi:hypothetical protein
VGLMKSAPERPLRPGDIVEVRSPEEILATLDEDGTLDSMPFMPEMVRYAGRRFTVTRRVDKICDTIAATGSRRMHATVYLDDLRCDGSGHGGCQAGCLIYWKEAWLRRVDVHAGADEVPGEGTDELQRVAEATTRTVREDGADEVWRCQATDAFTASEPLKTSNPTQYWRELTNGNFGPLRFIRLMARAVVMELWSRLGRLKPLPLTGPGTPPEPDQPLDLQPGELVRVRSPEEIQATLDETGHNRRLSFDREMLPYCGHTFRVQERVNRIIDDRTGRMMNIAKDCIILHGTVCPGERSTGRWFCPRQIHAYWREAWLERVDDPVAVRPADGPAREG